MPYRPLPARLTTAVLAASIIGATGSFIASPDRAEAVQVTGSADRVTTRPTAHVDESGRAWAAASGFVGGKYIIMRPTPWMDIAGTTTKSVYYPELRGVQGWSRPVSAGTYRVTLKMREPNNYKPGDRVFDVRAEGQTVIGGLDIMKEKGRFKAHDRSFDVHVADGTLDLDFVASKDVPTISGISVQALTHDAPSLGLPGTGTHPTARLDEPHPAPTAPPVTGPVSAGFDLSKPTFEEHFEKPAKAGEVGSVYPGKFEIYNYGTSTGGKWLASNLSVADGKLKFSNRHNGTEPTSAGIAVNTDPRDRWGTYQTYGRSEVRVRADRMPGYGAAILWWPKGTWPAAGEIDFPEAEFTSTVNAFTHYTGAKVAWDQSEHRTNASWQDWHVYVTEWRPGEIVYYVDGVKIGRDTSRIPSSPFKFALQTGPHYSDRHPAASVSGEMEVDYIKIWRYDPRVGS